MLIFLKILSILGIILLVLLGFLLLVMGLVLFFPVTYKIYGRKNAEETVCFVKVRWLFGMLRGDYAYPKPGTVIVRFCGKVLFDSSTKPSADKSSKQADVVPKERNTGKEEAASGADFQEKDSQKTNSETASHEAGFHETASHEGIPAKEKPKGLLQRLKAWIYAKYEKIRYTIRHIYDKIKDILENISYYKALFQEEDTRLLYEHVKLRVGEVLRSIRPRKLKADILFGTGEPDITGYILAGCGMLSPYLGNNIHIVPDFENTVFEGEVYGAGHITMFVLLFNGACLFFDQRLHLFLRKLKREEKKNGR